MGRSRENLTGAREVPNGDLIPGRPGRPTVPLMPRPIPFAGALALVLALLALVPALAAATPRWLALQDLTPAGEPASSPRVVVHSTGTAVIAWVAHTAGGRVVRVAARAPGGAAWGAPADLSAPGGPVLSDLVVDAAGNVAALWGQPAAGPAGTVTLHAAIRPAGAAAFGPPEQVPTPGASVLDTALAADGAGNFIAAWSQATGGIGSPSTAFVSIRPVGGPWGAAETLSAPGDHALVSEAAGAGGRVAVVWTAASLGTAQRTVRLRERESAGGTWTAERVVSSAEGQILVPSVAMGPAGDALAAWFAASTTGPVVQAAFRPAGGEWAPPETLGPGGGFSLPPKAVVEPDGTASVVWVDHQAGGVIARVRAPGGGFGAAQAVSAQGVPVSPLPAGLAATGPDGGVVVVWAGGGLDGPRLVQAAVKAPGDVPFGPRATISAPGAGVGSQVAAMAPASEAVAAWAGGSGSLAGGPAIRTADYTERPGAVLEARPVAVAIADAPRTAVEGTRVRLRLAVDGFADGLVVRVQRHMRGAFRDTGQTVTVNGTSAELPVRLTFPGKLVLRLAYESRSATAYSRGVTILISRPSRPLIAAGTRPIAVRVGLGAVWVLTADDAGQGVVMRLDPRTGRPVGEPVAVGRASRLAVGAGAIWVSRGLEDDRGIVRIDPATGAVVAEIPVVTNGSLAAGPAGVWTVECARTTGFGTGCGEQRVARIDPVTNAVSQRFTVVQPNEDFSPSAGGLAVGRRFVWFSIGRDRDTSALRLDPASGRIVPVDSATGLVARGDVVWGLSGRTCRLTRGRGAGRLAERALVAGRPRHRCAGLAFDGRSAWVVQEANTFGIDPAAARPAARAVRIDAATARPVGRPIPLGIAPVSVDVGAGAVWAASAEEAVVRRIDPRAAGGDRPSARPHRPARPRSAWRRPATVPGSTARSVFSLDLATGPRGRAAAIWHRSEERGRNSVVSSVRPSGRRGWGPVRRLAPAPTNTFAGGPRLEMNAAGEAVAVWTHGGRSFAESSVQAALLGPRARAWGAATTLGEAGTGGIAPDAGIAADGEAVAVWSCLCTAGRGPTSTRHAVRPPGGAFGAAAPLDPAGAGDLAVLDSRLAVAPSGRAVAVWSPTPGGGVTAAARPAGGAFGAPVALFPRTILGGTNARIAVNDAGEAVAVWQGEGLLAARRAADGTWSTPERIARPGRYSYSGPEVALDAAGNALVAVRAFDLETYNYRVMTVALRPGAARWDQPVWLSPKGPTEGPPGPSAGDPSLAMNARGDAVVAWSQTVGGRPRALARLRPAGRLAWRPLEAVSGREGKVNAVEAAVDADGMPTAAWVAQVGTGPQARSVVRVASRAPLRAPARAG